jgi:hypothetical protein
MQAMVSGFANINPDNPQAYYKVRKSGKPGFRNLTSLSLLATLAILIL